MDHFVPAQESSGRICRFCGKPLTHRFADLGAMPPANAYIKEPYHDHEWLFPLCAYVCEACKLVQVEEFESPENIFEEYGYFSSVSNAWLKHCRVYCEKMRDLYHISSEKFIVEVASNDGYLLQNFKGWGNRVLGVEPAKNVAEAAKRKGINTVCKFFNEQTAKEIIRKYGKADLIVANNVLAHTPQLNDFVEGLSALLDEKGLITLEFPHLLTLIQQNEFDTIYHEHFSYFSILTLRKILAAHNLDIFQVEKLPTHGGSLRVYACHCNVQKIDVSVDGIIREESVCGLDKMEIYDSFQAKIDQVKRNALSYLIEQKNQGKRIAAFGAAAKGSTFLNYCGIGRDIISYVVDETPYKQGLFVPGVRIPIVPFQMMCDDLPDVVVILPWNWTEEILSKLSFILNAGGKVVTFIPALMEYT